MTILASTAKPTVSDSPVVAEQCRGYQAFMKDPVEWSIVHQLIEDEFDSIEAACASFLTTARSSKGRTAVPFMPTWMQWVLGFDDDNDEESYLTACRAACRQFSYATQGLYRDIKLGVTEVSYDFIKNHKGAVTEKEKIYMSL